jgi:hypothetical protein
MADNTVKIDLQIASQGMDPAVQKSQTIKDNLTAAGSAMGRTGSSAGMGGAAGGRGSVGGTAGSRAVSERASGQEYAAQRAVAGVTGASARNFAAESQGLGGLVRLYATLAANTYAAAAAFKVLSDAMNTTNMIKGLDQLGAASGKNLGTLSKRIYDITEGSISMRQAMEATTKAASSGMSAKTLEALTKGAKSASQTLGLDMGDALNRLIRGVAKLEPELLDELGLFISIDEASAKYAKSLGVSANSLTNVQKRAAFAQEALGQLNDKYGAISIESNPYAKLAASLANILQTSLSFANTFIAPIAKVFSESTTLLSGAIALIGVKLIPSLLPALSQWRSGLKDAAAQAKKTAEELKTSFGENFVAKREAKFKVPQLEEKLAGINTSLADKTAVSPELQATKTGKLLAEGRVAELKSTNSLTTAIKAKQQAIKDMGNATDEQSKKTLAAHQMDLTNLEKSKQLLVERNKITNQLADARAKVQEEADTKVRFGSLEARQAKQYSQASAKDARLTVLSDVVPTTQALGFGAAMSKVYKDMDEKGVRGINAFRTAGTAAFIALTTTIASIISYLNIWITIVTGAITLLDLFLSKNGEALDTLNSSLVAVDESAKNASATLKNILNKPAEKVGSIASLQQISNALEGVVTSTNTAIQDYNKFKQATAPGSWDDKKDRLKALIFGGGSVKNLAKSMSESVSTGLELAASDPRTAAAKADVMRILNITDTNKESLRKAFEINPSNVEAVANIITSLQTKIKSTSDTSLVLSDNFKQAGDILQTITNNFLPQDNIAKLGTLLIDISIGFSDAMKDPLEKFREINAILQDSKKLSLLSPSDRDAIVNARADFEAINKVIGQTTIEQAKNTALIKEASLNLAQKKNDSGYREDIQRARTRSGQESVLKAQETLDKLKQEGDRLETILAKANSDASTLAAKTLPEGLIKSLELGAKEIQSSISTAFAKAALSMEQTRIIGASGQGVAAEQFRTTMQDIALQNRVIDVQLSLIQATNDLKDTEEKSNLIRLQQLASQSAEGTRARSEADTAYEKAKKIQEERSGFLAAAQKNPEKTISDIVAKITEASGKPGGGEDAARLSGILKSVQALAGVAAAQAEQRARAKGAVQTNAVGEEGEKSAGAIKDLNTKARALETAKTRAQILKEAVGLENDSYLKQVQSKEESLLINKLEQERVKYQEEYNKQKISADAGNKNAKAELTKMEELERKRVADGEDQLKNLKAKQDLETRSFVLNKQIRDQDNTMKMDALGVDIQKQRLEGLKAELDYKQAIGRISESLYAKEEANIAVEQQRLAYAQEAAKIAVERARATSGIENKYESAKGLLAPTDTTGKADLEKNKTTELKRENDYYDLQNTALAQGNVQRTRAIELTRQQKLEQADHNKLLEGQKTAMDSLISTAESLGIVFGDIGKRFGDGLVGILQVTQDNVNKRIELDKQYAKDKLDLEIKTADQINAMSSLGSEEDVAKAQEDGIREKLALETKYNTKTAKLEEDKNLKLLGSTKKLFSEKSKGYKAIEAVEKVMHLKKLYDDNKELISTLYTEGKKLFAKIFTAESGVAATATAAASEMAINEGLMVQTTATATPGIFARFSEIMGPWGWAAAAAVVAAIAGMGGASGGYSGPSEASLAKASGTGMEYNSDNKLVAREGGVVGDPMAKAESLSKSIDLLGETFFDSLDSESSNLIKYLKAIDDNTKGLAKAMLEQAGFFTGGDILGIKEGTDGGGLIGAIFGKTTTTIDRAGLYVEGTLDQLTSLTEGINGAVAEIYANVTVEDTGLFGTGLFGSSNSYRTAQDLGAAGREALEGIFKNWKAALLLTAKGLEGGSARVETALKDIGKITLDVVRGEMTATEYATAVMNELSVKMNQATLATMPYIKEFTQIGEEYYEAANRLTKEAATISQGMRMLGKEGISGVEGVAGALQKIQVSKAFLDKFGGDLSKGAEAVQFYFDTFQTETEKNAYYATELSNGFKEIGYTTTLTLDQYKAAIASLNINDPGQAAQLANLLKLAPAYDKVNQAQQKTAGLQVDLLEAQGRVAEATAARRKQEYAALSDIDAAIKRRIDALEDEKTAYDKLHTALTDIIEGVKTSVKSLRDFAGSILTGSGSLTSPGEKLASSQRSFDKAIEAAKGPRDTADQRKAADAAAQDVVKYGQQVVDQATTMFASGPKTQEIINQVASATASVADKIETAQTDAQRTITEIETSNGYLKTIATTNHDLLIEYQKAAAASADAATPDAGVPQKSIGPLIKNTSEAPTTTVSDLVASQQTQLAAQKETNRLLQEQINTQVAQLLSNAKAMQAQTDALNAAAEERRQMAEYAARNAPVENGSYGL